MICPDGEGKGTAIALVEGVHYRGPMCVSCSRCKGTGETDRQTECWSEMAERDQFVTAPRTVGEGRRKARRYFSGNHYKDYDVVGLGAHSNRVGRYAALVVKLL